MSDHHMPHVSAFRRLLNVLKRLGQDGMETTRARLAKALGLSVYQLDKVIRDWIATGCLAKERRHRGIRIEVLA